MIKYKLSDYRALVTGAASGIGLAVVERLARAGADVALNYLPGDERGPAAIQRLQAEGLSVIEAPGDVSRHSSARNMVETAIECLGGLNLLVNNAGTPGVTNIVPPADLDKMTDEIWSQVLQTNLMGSFWCARAASNALLKAKGAIVNTASISATDTAGSSLAYGASKAGVISLTKNLARALAPNVRVNAVSPGFVKSDWALEGLHDREQATAQRALLKRVSQPDDIAEVILFLGCGAAMITGQVIRVDGGFTLADSRQ